MWVSVVCLGPRLTCDICIGKAWLFWHKELDVTEKKVTRCFLLLVGGAEGLPWTGLCRGFLCVTLFEPHNKLMRANEYYLLLFYI